MSMSMSQSSFPSRTCSSAGTIATATIRSSCAGKCFSCRRSGRNSRASDSRCSRSNSSETASSAFTSGAVFAAKSSSCYHAMLHLALGSYSTVCSVQVFSKPTKILISCYTAVLIKCRAALCSWKIAGRLLQHPCAVDACPGVSGTGPKSEAAARSSSSCFWRSRPLLGHRSLT